MNIPNRHDPFPGTTTLIKHQVDIMEAYAEYIRFIATAKTIDEFELDVSRFHPTLLRDSILEAKNSRHTKIKPLDQRRQIHDIYTRKVKEMSALWPFVFCVENALRASLTEHYHVKFGKRDWWRDIDTHIIKGKAGNLSLRKASGNALSSHFGNSLINMMKAIMDQPEKYNELRKSENAGRFFYFLSLGHLSYFFRYDWNDAKGVFLPSVKGQTISSSIIVNRLEIIRTVRNSINHSNPVKNTRAFIAAAETISLALDVNLCRFDSNLSKTSHTRPAFTEKVAGRLPIS